MSRVADLVESSAIARQATALAARAGTYARASRLSHRLAAAAAYWAALPASERISSLGLVLVCAAVTHVALTLTQGAPGHWLWLIVPGIIASQGLLLMAMGRRREPRG